MTNDILYSFRRCPYAIRVRWALLICEVKVELREIDLKNKPIDFLNRSSTKTVPILIKKDGKTIEESLEIIIWTLKEAKKEEIKDIYLPDNMKEEIFEIINQNDNEFKYHLDRFKYSTRFKSINKNYHYLESCKFVERCNELLKKNRYFFGTNATIADWCIWPFIRQFKIACESQKKTNYFDSSIKNWLEYFEHHKNFKKLMYKYDLWQPSSKTNYFPLN